MITGPDSSAKVKQKAAEAIRLHHVKAIILAGGYGARMNAICNPTRNRYPLNKTATYVGTDPLISYSLRPLAELGIREVEVAVHHLADSVKQAVSSVSSQFDDFEVTCSNDLPDATIDISLDTAGAVAQIVRKRGWEKDNETVVVILSADIVHNFDLAQVIAAHLQNRDQSDAIGTMAITRTDWPATVRFGTVHLRGMPKRTDYRTKKQFLDAVQSWFIENQAASRKISQFREKVSPDEAPSNLINASIYIFNGTFFADLFPRLTSKVSGGPLFHDLRSSRPPFDFYSFGHHVFKWLTRREIAKRFPFFAYVLPSAQSENKLSYWKDIAFGEDLRQANMDLLDGRINRPLMPLVRGGDVFISRTAQVDPQSPTVIGDHVIIEDGAYISHSVIGADTVVGAGARIENSVIFPKPAGREKPNIIGRGAALLNCVFCGGSALPGSRFDKTIFYSPAGGGARDSLYERIRK